MVPIVYSGLLTFQKTKAGNWSSDLGTQLNIIFEFSDIKKEVIFS